MGQMKKQGQQADGSEQSAMMDMMADSQTVDIVPLIPAVPSSSGLLRSILELSDANFHEP